MNIKTLERLARNPYYKMGPKELKALEEYRNKKFKAEHRNEPIKHSTKVQKHPTKLKEEDNELPTTNRD